MACALTGKVGGTNLGLFAIDDRAPGETVAPGDPLYDKRAINAVGRVSQDFGKGSSVGPDLYRPRSLAAGGTALAAWTSTLRLSRHVDRRLAEGGELDAGRRDEDGGGYSAGPAAYLGYLAQGHAFNLFSNSADFSTGFQTHAGVHPDQQYAQRIIRTLSTSGFPRTRRCRAGGWRPTRRSRSIITATACITT